MKKIVHVESSLKRYLALLKCDGFTAGLLLGQSSPIKEFVVHLARTVVPKDRNVTNIHGISDLKEEHVIEHIRNVIQILPGGMTVLGLFFIGDASLLNANALGSVRNILNAIFKYQTENENYFFDTQQNAKYVLHYVDDDNISCKRFSPSKGGNQFDNAEFVFSSNSWHRVTCYYDFEHLLPFYLETVSNAVLQDKFMEILRLVSHSVKKSILSFGGEVKNESELIKCVKERSNKRSAENLSDSRSSSQIIVDLFTSCIEQSPDISCKISDYAVELKCFGTLCSDVYLHDDAIVSEVIKAVKEDIIRSLCSRLTMHCNSLMEDLSSSGVDEVKLIHEPPRRVSVMLPYSKVRFTDYLFPGEDNLSSLPAKEQLDIRDIEDETKLYELLEMESDASEYYNTDGGSNDVIEKVDMKKNNLPFKISVGVVFALLLLILAVFVQKVRSP